MSTEIILLITLLVIIAFLALGMYIHSVLLIAGIIGITLLEGPSYFMSFIKLDPFTRVASYSLSTIPLFVLMAQFVVRSGIVGDLYLIVSNISRGRSGVLGVLTVFAGGLLGAVSGSTNASAAAMGRVSVPQLIARGYGKGLAGATAAVSGALSSVIPPSVILILWGVATETSIGGLFMGSLIPGLIMIVLISVVLIIMLKFFNDNKEAKKDKFKKDPITFSRVFFALFLTSIIAFTVFYGIYAGVFTPTEAGAMGATAAFIIALLLGKVNKRFFLECFSDTVKITAMIMMIMIGAQLFGRFISLSLLPRKIIEFLGTLVDYPILILIIVSLLYFILFMFIEGAAVIVMTAPVIVPLILETGYDPLWFGVFVCILCTLGLLTPPVGLAVFSVAGITGISNEVIFKYSLIYAAVLSIIILALITIFPEIVTWLPSRM